MAIIAISNIPAKMNLKQLVKCLAPIINGYFVALNFHSNQDGRTAYVRLAETLNAKEVVNRIKRIGSNHVKAYIPDVIPNLQLSHRPKTIPTKIRRKLRIPQNNTPKELLNKSLHGLMLEIQSKYPGLHTVSAATKHQLIENIGKIVYRRLVNIQADPSLDCDNCFKMTKTYRKQHPHGEDFPLIKSTLHGIEDAEGKPRTQLHEEKLLACSLTEYSAMPYEKMEEFCRNHITRISNQLQEHINNLEVSDHTSTAAEAAQMKVRKHLKNLAMHIPDIVAKVIMNHMMPSGEAFHIVKIYGEPYLPNKEALQPFTKKYRIISAIRAENMYNLISVKVPRDTTLLMLQADGKIINGNAKLVIRPGKLPVYKVFKYMETESDELVQPKVQSTQAQGGESGEGRDKEMDWADSW